jgi:preprotein translocase subunit YajC
VNASFLVIVALFVVFWLLLIRPQRRRQRAQDEMLASLRVGDEIVTAGGLYGEITAIEDDEVYVEIAEGVEVRVARRAIAGVMPDEDEDEDEEDETTPEDADQDVEPGAEPPSKAGGES